MRPGLVGWLVAGLLALPTVAAAYEFPEDEAAAAFVASNTVSTFYHELGHALIDVLQLPVLGREEDAADTLSTLLIHQIWDEDSATAMVYDTAYAFQLYAAEAEAEGYEMPFWDEHSLDMQRYFNMVCLFYGASPDTRDDVAAELELPEDRAERCADEFDLADASWGVMLEDLEPGPKPKGLRMVGANSDDPLVALIAEEIADLNARYGLPEWIDVKVEACGEANAFYDPGERSITLCSEYPEDLQRIWDANF